MLPERYENQVRLANVGTDGQSRIRRSRVLVVGVGGLGCASSAYLAMAGVGAMRLVDGDTVAISNLARQMLFTNDDVGRSKVEVAAKRLRQVNPEVEIEEICLFAQPTNLLRLLDGVDVVVDGTDSLEARRMLNRTCVERCIPVVFGAASGFNGSVMACVVGGPCYDCVWSGTNEQGCDRLGVLGPLVGMVGCAQATEALRVLLGLGEPGRLLLVDALRPEWRTVQVKRRVDCRTCGEMQHGL